MRNRRNVRAKQNGKVFYVQLEILDERLGTVGDLLWAFSGDKQLLEEVLEAYKELLAPKTPVEEAVLSAKGKKMLEEHNINIDEEVLSCKDIKEYIL